jgi:single-strand DNA-binding protein
MAKSINRVTLLGNVGKDPEVKFLPSGQAVANFSIATSDRYKDKAGEWQDRTEWHNLAAFARTAEIVRDYVKKGSKIYVEGRLTTRSWDDKDSGKKVYKTEIMVNELVLLSGRGEGEGGGGGGSYGGNRQSSGGQGGYDQRTPAAPAHDDYGDTGITDDDIPF